MSSNMLSPSSVSGCPVSMVAFAEVVEVGRMSPVLFAVGVSTGKDEAENLRAEVKMEVELSDVSDGKDVMKEPRSPELQRPDLTV